MYDDERSAYEGEIRQLKDENGRLRKENLGWQTKYARLKDENISLQTENANMKAMIRLSGGFVD